MKEKNGILNRLYYEASDEDSSYADDFALCGLYRRMAKTRQEEHKLSECLDRLSISVEVRNELDTDSIEIALAYEEQGFINGFRMGLRLAMEAMV